MYRRNSFVVIVFTLIAIVSVRQAGASTYEVTPDGGGDFVTIQAALDAVSNGDVIELTDGTFTGPGNRDLHVRSYITLRAQNGPSGLCIIDCQGSPGDPHFGIDFDEYGNYLEGITIQNAWVPGYGGALRFTGTALVIDGCIFWNNHAELGGGAISAQTVAEPHITNSSFFGNSTHQYGPGGAIFLDDDTQAEIEGCAFNGNWGDGGGAVYLNYSDANFRQCTINGSDGYGAALYAENNSSVHTYNTILCFSDVRSVICTGGSTATMSCTDIYGNVGGDWTGSIADQYGVNGNISADPLFCGVGTPFGLHENSPCAPAQSACGLIGRWPVSCGPMTYLVQVDGSGDFPTIQAALDGAAVGSIVELANGVYRGDGNRDLDFGGKALHLRSEGGVPGSCIIDCEGSSSDQHRAFDFASGEGPETVISGITITHGYMSSTIAGAAIIQSGCSPRFVDCMFVNNFSGEGGAVRTLPDSGVSFTRCKFIGNQSGAHAGAIYLDHSTDYFESCEFTDNFCYLEGGALYTNGADVEMISCEFTDNIGDHGGAASIGGGSVIASNCSFNGNSADHANGGGLHLILTDATIEDCTFTNNIAEDGGAIGILLSVVEISGCTLTDNTADYGGAIHWEDSEGTISECTLFRNVGDTSGGGLYCAYLGAPELSNVIIAFSSEGGAVHLGYLSDVPALVCCDLYGNIDGDWVDEIAGQYGSDGNISLDPLFCGFTNPDEPYTLDASSSCAAGNNPQCGQIGGWGVGCDNVAGIEGDSDITPVLTLRSISPNPFQRSTQIAYGIAGGAGPRPVSVTIFDAGGRLVRRLVERQETAGWQSVVWDGMNDSGGRASAGVYFCQIRVGTEICSERVCVIK